MKSRLHSPAGLTLLETILAISMLAMILVGLHIALSSRVRAYRRCRDTAERDTAAYGAMRLIADDLLRLVGQAPGESQPTFVCVPAVGPGGGCLLRLRTHARPAPGARAMLVDYFLMPGDEGKASVIRRSEPLAPGPEGLGASVAGWDDEQARYEVVATGIRGLRLRCFDGKEWLDRWGPAQQAGPPRLVEVMLDFPASGAGKTSYAQALPVVVEAPLIANAAGEGKP